MPCTFSPPTSASHSSTIPSISTTITDIIVISENKLTPVIQGQCIDEARFGSRLHLFNRFRLHRSSPAFRNAMTVCLTDACTQYDEQGKPPTLVQFSFFWEGVDVANGLFD